MTKPGDPRIDELIDRANDLLPALKERAQAAERLGTLPLETIDDLKSAGLLRIYQPSRYGGKELDWGAQIRIARVLGRACGSTAWIAAVLSTHSAMVGRMSKAAQDDVWDSNEHALIATGSARVAGTARRVNGGFELDGAWRFASGVDHTEWVMVPAPVEGVDVEGPAALRQCLIPSSEYRIEDDWQVSGLSGTGSKRVVVDEPIHIPEHRTIGFLELLAENPPGSQVNSGYVFGMEFRPYFGTILLGPVLGAAEGALADYLEATRSRIGAISGNRIAESAPVQLRVADSAAQIAGAGLMLDSMMDILHRRAVAGQTLPPQERVESMRDRAFITRECVDAVHRLVRQMGASGLSDSNPVRRHFRDISAMAAQIGLNWDRNAGAYGKWALGMPTGDSAIDGEMTTSTGDASDSVA